MPKETEVKCSCKFVASKFVSNPYTFILSLHSLLLSLCFFLKHIQTFFFDNRRVVLICGVVAGALLTILGIVTITGDTKDLFVCFFSPHRITRVSHQQHFVPTQNRKRRS